MHIRPSTFRTIATQYLNSSFPEPRRSTLVTDRVFKAHFKLGPTATAQVWYKLGEVHRDANSVYLTTDDPPLQISWNNNVLPKHLLWALHYMKTYLPEDQAAALFATSNKTFRKFFWALVFFLNGLCDDLVSTSNDSTLLFVAQNKTNFFILNFEFSQVRWENRHNQDNGSESKVSVDGVDFMIREPQYTVGTDDYRMWFSHKFNAAGLRYELGICIQTGDIVWIAGPFPPGDWPDVTIFQIGMMERLDEGETVEADAGYAGDIPVRTPDDFGGSIEWKRMKGRARARHETVNGAIKHYAIMTQKYRHSLHKHNSLMKAVCALVQSEIEEGNITFQIDYEIVRPYQNAMV